MSTKQADLGTLAARALRPLRAHDIVVEILLRSPIGILADG